MRYNMYIFMNIFMQNTTSRADDLERQGYSRTTLSRLVKQGQLKRIGRGLYQSPNHVPSIHHRLVQVALLAPKAAICLISALEYHQIGTQLAYETWLALPSHSRIPKLENTRVHLFDKRFFEVGLESHTIEGVKVRIYNPTRTIADCFKFRNQIGLDVALEALKSVLEQKLATSDQLWQMAQVCRVQKVLKPYLEALL
jgi:predicted transcriptional regulator of viral defense system